MGRKKRAFSLLEIMVVLGIIALTAPLLVSELFSNMRHWRFANASSFVYEELSKLHHLTLLYQIDTTFQIFQQEGIYYLKVNSAEPIKGVKTGTFKLTGIQEVRLDKEPKQFIEGKIYSAGKHNLIGVLEFQGQNEKDKFKINFNNIFYLERIN